jgi:hypothetical protein
LEDEDDEDEEEEEEDDDDAAASAALRLNRPLSESRNQSGTASVGTKLDMKAQMICALSEPSVVHR